jgi:hypothetical protein
VRWRVTLVYLFTCLMVHDGDDDGPGREDSMKLSTIAREYRGRDSDLACLAVGGAR